MYIYIYIYVICWAPVFTVFPSEAWSCKHMYSSYHMAWSNFCGVRQFWHILGTTVKSSETSATNRLRGRILTQYISSSWFMHTNAQWLGSLYFKPSLIDIAVTGDQHTITICRSTFVNSILWYSNTHYTPLPIIIHADYCWYTISRLGACITSDLADIFAHFKKKILINL